MPLLAAQARANFVGHWELFQLAPGVRAAMAIDVRESGESPRVLTVTRYFEGGDTETRDYPLAVDSGRVGGTSVFGGIPLALSFQSVRWDNASLLIDQESDSEAEHHERWSLNAAGQLVIESADKPLVLATSTVSVKYRKR